jgi:MFS family permease
MARSCAFRRKKWWIVSVSASVDSSTSDSLSERALETTGRRIYRPGTAGAAMAERSFRIMWIGSFASNIGTWMQNTVLPKYAHDLGDANGQRNGGLYVGMVIMAQLSPLLLAPLGGVFADRFRRKPYLIACQVQQLVFSLLLAVVVAASASIGVVVAVALAIGIGNALNAPAWSAVMPQLVRKENMPGAISMNSAMVNGSRVVGPAIVAVLVSAGLGSGGIFAINAATYLFVIVALLSIVIADPAADTDSFRRRLGAGFREARHNPVVGRGLTILVLFSLLCLPYVGQFATVAARNFGVADGSRAYYWIYAVWGFGACCGGLSIATVLSRIDPKRLVPAMLLGFAASLAVFSLLRSTEPAYPVGFVLGFCYFGMTTSLLTVVQQHLGDQVRGRVMALWFMGFGGTVPFGSLGAGWLMDHVVSVTTVLLIGSATAVLLAWLARDLVQRSDRYHAALS